MMSNSKGSKNYVGYDYLEAFVDRDKTSLYLDAYQNFGWELEDDRYATAAFFPSMSNKTALGKVHIKLRRDRKIINKAELTRLQRHFEGSVDAIAELEKSKTSKAMMVALIIGIIGAAFMAGSVFAVTAEPPMILLCIILAIPALIGWVLPYFVYKSLVKSTTKTVTPLIEQQYDEIYEICEKGNKLL